MECLQFKCAVCDDLRLSICDISWHEGAKPKRTEKVCERCLLWAVMLVEGLQRDRHAL